MPRRMIGQPAADLLKTRRFRRVNRGVDDTDGSGMGWLFNTVIHIPLPHTLSQVGRTPLCARFLRQPLLGHGRIGIGRHAKAKKSTDICPVEFQQALGETLVVKVSNGCPSLVGKMGYRLPGNFHWPLRKLPSDLEKFQ